MTNLVRSTLLCAAVSFTILPARSVRAQAVEDATPTAAIKCGDDGLFKGLTPAKPVAPATKLEDGDDASSFGGEDIELPGNRDPFARLATKMQRSKAALTAGDASPSTHELQQEILGDLDSLLKKMQKRCSGGQCKKPGGNSSASKSGAGAQRPSQKPSNDSTARVGEPGSIAGEGKASSEEALREVWGHLPAKVREAMQNASLEDFLPKYDKLIEDFYRRLAEQPAASR